MELKPDKEHTGGRIMGKIKKIVVAVDGSVHSANAVEKAVYLAEKVKASLEFVYVSTKINKDIPSHIVFDHIWENLPKEIEANKHTETGAVSDAVIKVAKETSANLIVIGSRGLGLFKGAILGSVSQKVVEDSPIPVMVVK